ncbi:hypothetical protein BD413DRAFT_519817 [Trametes elegans]|nr:hypothetical protein BD413DRAFT_519817 [Trametes elegans]
MKPISATERVPAEIWLFILELVPATADLHSLSFTCRKLYDLSVRALHRDLIWTDPTHVSWSLPVWNSNPGMDVAVRSLVLGVSTLWPDSRALPLVGVNGTVTDTSSISTGSALNVIYGHTLYYYDLWKTCRGGFASPDLHDAMMSRIQTFSNISSLTFYNMLIYDLHLQLIHSFTHLRSLSFELCIFTERDTPLPTHHPNLPITELTMLNMRPHVLQSNPHHVVPPQSDLTHVMSLASAPHLRKLTVDSTADVFKFIYKVWPQGLPIPPGMGWAIPAGLEDVFVVCRRLYTDKVQPSLNSGESTLPETYLNQFAVRAHSLRTLSAPLFGPQDMLIETDALPGTLKRFAAPVGAAMIVAEACELEALGVLKCGLGSRETINALETISSGRPGLKMLMIELRAWDDEVVPAIADLFSDLRRLKILYEGEVRPSEDSLVMLAPEFLVKMPHLHTIQLYAQPGQTDTKPHYPECLYDDSYASIEEELRNMVIPYNRFCPNLRKVQFCSGYIMTRRFDGAPWELERVRRLEVTDDLSF